MQKLTVAMDLRAATPTLVEFAGYISLAFGADVNLVHVREVADPASSGAPAGTPGAPAGRGVGQRAFDKLQEAARSVRMLTHRKVWTTLSLVRGPVVPILLKAALGSDLLLLGQGSVRGLWQPVIAGVTDRILGAAPCPVLVIPRAAHYERPGRIALAVGEGPRLPPGPFTTVRKLAHGFGSTIDVCHRPSSPHSRGPAAAVEGLLGDTKFTYRSHPGVEAVPLTDYLLGAAADDSADWIAVIHHRRAGWRELLGRSESEHLARESELPVLVLHDRAAAVACERAVGDAHRLGDRPTRLPAR